MPTSSCSVASTGMSSVINIFILLLKWVGGACLSVGEWLSCLCSWTNNNPTVVSSNTALTGNFPDLQHLPTPVHPAVMRTWKILGYTNSLAMTCLSAKGPGGTSGAHTHKLRVLLSHPAGS